METGRQIERENGINEYDGGVRKNETEGRPEKKVGLRNMVTERKKVEANMERVQNGQVNYSKEAFSKSEGKSSSGVC